MVDQVGGGDGGTGAFEEELGGALRRAGEQFGTDGEALVDAGVRGGRRRLRRRRAGAVGGSVMALAVVGLGASYVGGAFDAAEAQGSGVAARPSASSAKSDKTKGAHGTGPAVSEQRVIGILQGLLPKGKFSGQEGRGTDQEPGPYARLVYDDGDGKAAIGVGFGAVDPDGEVAKQQLECPDKNFVPHDECRNEKLSDGSRLHLMRGYEYPDRRVDTKMWSAVLITPEGYTVSVTEWNAPAEKDAPVSRPEPPLSTSQLKTLATSKEWRPVMAAIGAAPAESLAAPPALGQDKASILKNLKSLLPDRVKVKDQGGQEAGYAYVVVDDGKGATLVQINVQPKMKDVESQLFGSGAEELPDGTKVATRKGDGDDKGGAGIVMWTADTLRPDGLRVVVSAFNSGAQNKDATRPEPALTMAELKAVALSGKWEGGGK
ncbi:hypothetical protein GTY65_40680 [Streptomyces sp. SID8379]|uniref:hypothetical protein n=1 Tax=unclassified Streptomyces TaxID=2593676 RepID=UPI000375E2A0|nr:MULTISPECIES: hypothetical protein [unclassified Streptomyces]MYW70322.1 hypothetical protein [Streptomyces sp. SID8379]